MIPKQSAPKCQKEVFASFLDNRLFAVSELLLFLHVFIVVDDVDEGHRMLGNRNLYLFYCSFLIVAEIDFELVFEFIEEQAANRVTFPSYHLPDQKREFALLLVADLRVECDFGDVVQVFKRVHPLILDDCVDVD